MGWFVKMDYCYGTLANNIKPKDPNSNSALRGYEKRLAYLLTKEQTPRVLKEIKKLHKKIEAQKNKIKKQNDKRKRC